MMRMYIVAALSILWIASIVDAYNLSFKSMIAATRRQQQSTLNTPPIADDVDDTVENNDAWNQYTRRNIMIASITVAATASNMRSEYAFAAETTTSLASILSEIQNARKQMNAVPDLIKKEQWDGVRAILISPPLSDLWTKSGRKSPLLQDYANAIGAIPSGDELAVLEAKEDVEGHLRFLDMAVYNNNFNPIKSVGEIGATKALISSYYDDPINEYKATIAALDTLIQLGNVQ
jgi:hypothetical protein